MLRASLDDPKIVLLFDVFYFKLNLKSDWNVFKGNERENAEN